MIKDFRNGSITTIRLRIIKGRPRSNDHGLIKIAVKRDVKIIITVLSKRLSSK
ncbi:hypothetical protein D3C81_2087500 [compost metagenome]